MFFWLRTLFLLLFLSSNLHNDLVAQGFVQKPPLPASAAFSALETTDGSIEVLGNYNNYNFNAQATLFKYRLAPTGEYLGVSDSLRNSQLNDYWLWLTESSELLTFRHRAQVGARSVDIERFRADSSQIFKRTVVYTGADSVLFQNVKELRNRDVFAVGFIDTSTTFFAPYLECMRISRQGDIVWSNRITLFPGQNVSVDAFLSAIRELPNGDIAVILMADNKPVLLRINANGSLIYRIPLSNLNLSQNPAGAIGEDGTLFFCFNDQNSGALYLIGFDALGTPLWQKDLRAVFGADIDPGARYQLTTNSVGNVVFAGNLIRNGTQRYLMFAELNKISGATVRTSSFAGLVDQPIRLLGSLLQRDGRLLFCGVQGTQAVVIQTNALLVISDGYLRGRVVLDADKNCIANHNEPSLNNTLVEANNGQTTFHAITDEQGRYAFDNIPSGAYTITLKQQNYTWDPCPIQTAVVNHDTTFADVAVKVATPCALMRMDISAPFVRYCAPNTWSINYQNYGSDTAKNVRIELFLDTALLFQSASLPPASVNGQKITFNLPNVAPTLGGRLQINAQMRCNLTSSGRSVCIRGQIFPDTLCINNLGQWTGSMIEAIPECLNDTAQFQITNKGKVGTTSTFEFIIIEDHVVMRTAPINPLAPGQSVKVKQFSPTGRTVRFLAPQSAGHPLADSVTVAVEGCTTGPNTSTGFINEFPNRTGNPFSDLACDEIVSHLPNEDKRAFPKGYQPEQFINRNTPIEYMIRFQNTGTDTVSRVVVIDTLSPLLDRSSVRRGASSHPYQFSFSPSGALVFTFDPIILPDSSRNERASHGFVQLYVQQKPNLPYGSVIYNTASVYFDSGKSTTTSQTFHQIKLINAQKEIKSPEPSFELTPNPATNACLIAFRHRPLRNGQIRIIDLFGMEHKRLEMPHEELHISHLGLPAGVYMVTLYDGVLPVSAQKLVVIK